MEHKLSGNCLVNIHVRAVSTVVLLDVGKLVQNSLSHNAYQLTKACSFTVMRYFSSKFWYLQLGHFKVKSAHTAKYSKKQ